MATVRLGMVLKACPMTLTLYKQLEVELALAGGG